MANITRFEDLKVWQRARVLCQQTYQVAERPDCKADYRFCSQWKASAGSVMDNVAEGFERDGTKEFMQFLSIAKGSLGEHKSQSYRALDNRYISQSEFDDLYKEADEIGRMIAALIDYLKKSDIRGSKYKKIN